jgi:soluble lytic murein transglycosylase-like protein
MTLTAMLAVLAGAATGSTADAQAVTLRSSPAPRQSVALADVIDEAARTFRVPARWIFAVVRAESAFDPRATSPKGAMGLMQLMPQTWALMRARLGLGADPYDPHDNILAGTGYLRDLYDSFGPAGFLAAYNAGPGRYLEFLTRRRPLPPETRRYVAVLAAAITSDNGSAVASAAPLTPSRPTLFVPRTRMEGAAPAIGGPSAPRMPADGRDPAAKPTDGLFARPWGRTTP